MNKKYLFFGLLGIFAVGFVSAVAYYTMFSTVLTVQSSISISECSDELSGWDGTTVVGKECVITNNAPSDREIIISSSETEGITTTYNGKLILTKKNAEWTPIEDTKEVTYTMVGDSFEVTGVPEGYTAIYYKDAVIGLEGRLENPQPAVSIVGIGNLPEVDDANMDEEANYCQEPDNYNQCRGAKIWLIPNTAITEGVIDWSQMSSFYFETDLIQYNSEGNIVLSPSASLTIIPVYTIDAGVVGEHTITTTIA